MDEIEKISSSVQQRTRKTAQDLQQMAENQEALVEQQKQIRGSQGKFDQPPSMGIAGTEDTLTAYQPDDFLARVTASGPGEDSTATLSEVLDVSKKRISDYLEGTGSSEIVYMMTTMLEYVKMLSDRVKEKQKMQAMAGEVPALANEDLPTPGNLITQLIKFSENLFHELAQKPNQDTVSLNERYNSLTSWLKGQQ